MTRLGRTTMAVGAMIMMVGGVVDADAATARVRCRVRAARTQVSIDGKQLAPGSYTATVDSATDAAGAVTSKAAVLVVAPARMADFDFDSNAKDVRAGATELPANFATQGDSVKWELLKGGVAILSGTQACTR